MAEINVGQALMLAHDKILAEYFQRDQSRLAYEMEACLRLLKSPTQDWMPHTGIEEIDEQFAELGDQHQEQMEAFFKSALINSHYHKLFAQPHKRSKKGKNLPEIFELGFNNFLQALYGSNQTFFVGADQGNIKLDNILEEDVKHVMNGIKEYAIQIGEQNSVAGLLYNMPEYREQKVDINTTTIQITSVGTSYLSYMRALFAGHTYTLKNYKEYQYFTKIDKKWTRLPEPIISQYDIKLGDTHLYKVLYAPLSSVFDTSYAKRVLYASVNELNNNPAVALHFFHLRFIYELTGLGLVDQELKPLKEAEFIIINRPDTPDIYVRSTSTIINSVLRSDNTNVSFLKTVKLTRNQFEDTNTINIDLT